MGLTSRPSYKVSNVYKKTTTSNPYAYSKTDNSSTISGFQEGSALQSVYNYVNKSVDSLLDEYMNPNLNSTVNSAKLNSFANTLANQTRTNFENNIINPLSKRNMLRSSQVGDLYKYLVNQNVSSVANYANDLIANSQDDTAKMLSNLLSYYMQGADYLTDMQNHSLKASSGNADRYNITQTGNNNGEIIGKAIGAVLSILSSMV